jgi:hypothetical protein
MLRSLEDEVRRNIFTTQVIQSKTINSLKFVGLTNQHPGLQGLLARRMRRPFSAVERNNTTGAFRLCKNTLLL